MKKYAYSDFSIGLCGNPNVGKSTIFNALTGLSQHTGNWTGKTVELAYGYAEYNSSIFKLVDLPGIYSLFSDSAEEEVAREFICGDSYDALIVVLDATCLERNLYLAMQVLSITDKVAICVNLMDEAQRKGIHIDIKKLENLLGVPVVGTSAGKKKGLPLLMDAVCKQAHHSDDDSHKLKAAEFMLSREDDKRCAEKSSSIMVDSEHVAKEVIDVSQNSGGVDRKLDNIFTSKRFGIPIMGLFIGLIFWITLTGSNYPSSLLFELFGFLEKQLSGFAERLFSPSAVPVWIQGLFIEGCFRTTGWVVSVMLPPMGRFTINHI